MEARIAIDPAVHFGKPCVAGTRITVESVMELLEAGLSLDQVRQDYHPELSAEDLRACVKFARSVLAAEEIHLERAGS